LNPSKGY